MALVTKEQIPYYSGSYSASLTDRPHRQGRPKSERAAPYNFFYGPSYSDAAPPLVQWAADDWKARAAKASPSGCTWAPITLIPIRPRRRRKAYAKELGFEVLEPITFALTPGDYNRPVPDAEAVRRQLRLSRQYRRSNISVLKACETAGVKVQFLGNVWGNWARKP